MCADWSVRVSLKIACESFYKRHLYNLFKCRGASIKTNWVIKKQLLIISADAVKCFCFVFYK